MTSTINKLCFRKNDLEGSLESSKVGKKIPTSNVVIILQVKFSFCVLFLLCAQKKKKKKMIQKEMAVKEQKSEKAKGTCQNQY